MAPSSSSKSPSPPPPPHQSPRFTPIQECETEEQEDCTPNVRNDKRVAPKKLPTPIHGRHNGKSNSRKEIGGNGDAEEEDGSVSCNKCRPNSREKISVVPLDNNNGVNKHSLISMASPNGIFKSVLHSLTRKSSKSIGTSSAKEEQWKVAVTDLSHKLIQATRKRDEALHEASRLKYSMSELEKKLNKLEIYCHKLKSGLDECNNNNNNTRYRIGKVQNFHQLKTQNGLIGADEQLIQQFLVTVSEARSSIRLLSKSLTMQLRQMGSKICERISMLLHPYDIKISHSKNPKSLLLYLEALLNKSLFEDFESIGFQKNAANQILNPINRSEANLGSFNDLQGLTWEEVLNKGTRHFSEEFSKFCDRKMSEIVAMLGWNRAWPEPLLQAFFCASKSVWLVHLLANSVHPGLPIFRVDKGVEFDSVYMEDMDGERARKMVPTRVRIMITPGFYVYGNVVKCKVICRYNNNMDSNSIEALTLTPSP